MSTPVFICGAECGIAVVGTVSAGTEHWSSVNGAGLTVVTSGPSPMRSTRCFRGLRSAATGGGLQHTFATAVGSPATLVARFYVYFATLPSVDATLFEGLLGTNTSGVVFDQSDSTLRAFAVSPTLGRGASGIAVTTGAWYRVDVKLVTGATQTADIQVDGSAAAQATRSGTAGTAVSAAIEVNSVSGAAFTADAYIDDVIMSGTSADYPIGAGTVDGLYPNADGTHGGTWASGVFAKGAAGATAAARTDTDIWQSLNQPLTTTIGKRVTDVTGTATTDYVEFALDDTPSDLPSSGAVVNGVQLVVAGHSASTTASNTTISLRVDSPGSAGTTTPISLDLSEATITFPIAVQTQNMASVMWTKADLDNIKIRFSSTDSNPDVYLNGVCLEVDYVQTAGGTPISDTETGTAADTEVSIANALSTTETAVAADAGEAISVAIFDSDTAASVDAGEVVNVPFSDTETAVSADAETVAPAVADTESGTGADIHLSLSSAVAGTESGAGADAGESTASALTDTDTGASGDTDSPPNQAFTDPDTATGTEAGTIATTLADDETGVLADTESILATALTDAESGALSDTESVDTGATTTPISDAETATETEAEAVGIVTSVSDADTGSSLFRARNFLRSNAADKIILGLGAGGSLSGAITLAAIVRKASDFVTNNGTIFSVGGTNLTQRSLVINTASLLQTRSSNVAAASTTTVLAADGWCFVAATKAAGAGVAPRLHIYKFSTGVWTHETSATAQTDSTPDVDCHFGVNIPTAGNGWFDGDISLGGAWGLAMTDLQIEALIGSLADWVNSSPSALWVLNQPNLATPVTDLTGNGANQTSVVGTTVVSSLPQWGGETESVGITSGGTTPTDADAGSGVDAGESIASPLTDLDVGAAVDAEQVNTAFTDPDTGVVVDVGAIATTLTDAESGFLVEAETLAPTLLDSESATLVDTESVAAALIDADTAISDDQGTVGGTSNPTDNDTGVWSDAELVAAATSDAEVGTVTELETLGTGLIDPETGSAVDAATVAAALSDVDSGLVDDQGTVGGGTTPFDNESVTGTDLEVSVAAALVDAETAAAADAGSVASVDTKSDVETGSGVDTESLSAALTDPDLGTAVDTESSVSSPLSDADSGSGSEAALSVALSAAETAAIVDAEAGIAVLLNDADFATVLELEGLLASLNDIDTAIANDAVGFVAQLVTDGDFFVVVDAGEFISLLTISGLAIVVGNLLPGWRLTAVGRGWELKEVLRGYLAARIAQGLEITDVQHEYMMDE